jgi:predicted nucleic acid-binding protein
MSKDKSIPYPRRIPALPVGSGSVAAPSTRLRAYVDTSVVSVHARGEHPDQQQALRRILLARTPGVLDVYVSDLVRAELERVPAKYLPPHLEVFDGIAQLGVVSWIQATPPFGPTGHPHRTRTHPLLKRLLDIGLERADAEHIFQVAQQDLRYFITIDNRTILRRATDVQAACGVRALTPVDFEKLLPSSGASMTGFGS